jgi:hypothetical protein
MRTHITLAAKIETDAGVRARNLFYVWEHLRRQCASLAAVTAHRIAAADHLWPRRAIAEFESAPGLDD